MTTPRLSRFLSISLLFLLVLSGCASPTLDESVATFVQQQTRAAEAAAQAGDPARALAYLRTILPLQPDNTDVNARIDALREQIDRELAAAMRNGRAAYARGDRRAGDAAMLQALALKPGDPDALALLRQSVSVQTHAQQEGKVAAEFARRTASETAKTASAVRSAYETGNYRLAVELGEATAYGDKPGVQETTLKARLGLADRARSAGDPVEELEHIVAARKLAEDDLALAARERELRTKLSDQAYQGGLSLMQSDLAAAIAQFEAAVQYLPENFAAQTKLNQARKLKENLERIRGF